jgi:hypothetical protein
MLFPLIFTPYVSALPQSQNYEGKLFGGGRESSLCTVICQYKPNLRLQHYNGQKCWSPKFHYMEDLLCSQTLYLYHTVRDVFEIHSKPK